MSHTGSPHTPGPAPHHPSPAGHPHDHDTHTGPRAEDLGAAHAWLEHYTAVAGQVYADAQAASRASNDAITCTCTSPRCPCAQAATKAFRLWEASRDRLLALLRQLYGDDYATGYPHPGVEDLF